MKTQNAVCVVCRKEVRFENEHLFWHIMRWLEETHRKLNIFSLKNWLRSLKKKLYFSLETFHLRLGSKELVSRHNSPVSPFFMGRKYSSEGRGVLETSVLSGGRSGALWSCTPAPGQAQCSTGLGVQAARGPGHPDMEAHCQGSYVCLEEECVFRAALHPSKVLWSCWAPFEGVGGRQTLFSWYFFRYNFYFRLHFLSTFLRKMCLPELR